MSKIEKREFVKANAMRKATNFRTLFSSPAGKEVLQALEDEFIPDMLAKSDPHETYYALGQRDVVIYIKQLLKASEKRDE